MNDTTGMNTSGASTPSESGAPQTVGQMGLVVVSPRVPAGLMTRSAWQRIEAADVRLARSMSEPLAEAVDEAELSVDECDLAADELAAHLVRLCAQGDVVWLGSADADPGLTDALATELTRLENPPTVEVIVGSWDAPGSRLLDAVAVMDALRSPGGCPWDAKQTHSSLAPYLIEEAFEVTEAIAEQDSNHLAEELGDVLLQVLFHSRVASERGQDGFDIDDVAGALVEKLVRRHPHVFADADAINPEEVEAQWAQIKAAENPERDANDPLAGIPSGLPPLERAAKMTSRLAKAGRSDVLTAASQEEGVGPALLDLVIQAKELGVDPSVALTATLSNLTQSVATKHARTLGVVK